MGIFGREHYGDEQFWEDYDAAKAQAERQRNPPPGGYGPNPYAPNQSFGFENDFWEEKHKREAEAQGDRTEEALLKDAAARHRVRGSIAQPIDPKWKEEYDRVMGTEIGSPEEIEAQRQMLARIRNSQMLGLDIMEGRSGQLNISPLQQDVAAGQLMEQVAASGGNPLAAIRGGQQVGRGLASQGMEGAAQEGVGSRDAYMRALAGAGAQDLGRSSAEAQLAKQEIAWEAARNAAALGYMGIGSGERATEALGELGIYGGHISQPDNWLAQSFIPALTNMGAAGLSAYASGAGAGGGMPAGSGAPSGEAWKPGAWGNSPYSSSYGSSNPFDVPGYGY